MELNPETYQELTAQTLAVIGLFTTLATAAGVARFWVDRKALYELCSLSAEISMAIAFALLDQVFPVVVLVSMFVMRVLWWAGRRLIILMLPLLLSAIGYVSTELSVAEWWGVLPAFAFLLGKLSEHFLSGNLMRGFLLPTNIMWAIHNGMIGYWSGVGHEIAQFISNSARINVSLREEISHVVDRATHPTRPRRLTRPKTT